MLDYFLDSKKIEWARVQPFIEGDHEPSQEDVAAFFNIARSGGVPAAVRALVKKGIPNLKADVMVGKSTLSLADAQQVIGKEDASSLGTVITPAEGTKKFLHGTWCRYGAVQVGVDDTGLVQGLRVDLAHFKG